MASEPNPLELQVVTPEAQVIRETVGSVQVPARAGYLGILPGHAPLLTEMGTGELSYLKDGEKYFAVVCGGFAEILSDRVTVLAETAERCEEIDVERARAARDRAQKRLSGHDPETDWKRAAAALERALVRLQVAAKGGGAATAADGRMGSR